MNLIDSTRTILQLSTKFMYNYKPINNIGGEYSAICKDCRKEIIAYNIKEFAYNITIHAHSCILNPKYPRIRIGVQYG